MNFGDSRTFIYSSWDNRNNLQVESKKDSHFEDHCFYEQ